VQGRFWNLHWLFTLWRVSFYQWLVRVHHSDHNRDVDGNNNGNHNGHNVLANCHANGDSYRCPIRYSIVGPDSRTQRSPVHNTNRGTVGIPDSGTKRDSDGVSFSSAKRSANIGAHRCTQRGTKRITDCDANCCTVGEPDGITFGRSLGRSVCRTNCVAHGWAIGSTKCVSNRWANRRPNCVP